MVRFTRCAALFAVAGLLLTGCGDGGSEDAGGGRGTPAARSSGPPAEGPERSDRSGLPASLTGQRLSWGRCASDGGRAPGGDWQCTTMKAPLDYAEPDGDTIGIALIRERSSGSRKQRIGSLVFNFGGPGGSGVSLLPAFADGYGPLRTRYDLVSFDPRGVARSEGVRCRDDKEAAAAERTVDLTPDTAAEQKAYFADAAAFGAGCLSRSGRLLAHISTQDAARDLDLMRQVLGDNTLHYLGVSYGTELGGSYAHLFPRSVGRLVLDAVVDPTAGMVQEEKNQTRGFQRALDNYLTSTGQDPERGSASIAALLKQLDAKPLPVSGGRRLTDSLALTGITITLYSKNTWPLLTEGLEAARKGDGAPLLRLADQYNDRDPSGHYGTQSHSQRAISCRDTRERPTPAEARRSLAEFREISPVFGDFLAWDSAGWCHDWPVPGLSDTTEVSAPGAAPILVVGNTGDPATPYEGARRMADELGKGVGVELTWKGQGHGAYGNGSGCVDSTVNAYLLQGSVPRDGKVCAS